MVSVQPQVWLVRVSTRREGHVIKGIYTSSDKAQAIADEIPKAYIQPWSVQ